jgi:hypothetical protein
MSVVTASAFDLSLQRSDRTFNFSMRRYRKLNERARAFAHFSSFWDFSIRALKFVVTLSRKRR